MARIGRCGFSSPPSSDGSSKPCTAHRRHETLLAAGGLGRARRMKLSRDAKFWITVAVLFAVVGFLLDMLVGF